ncbi:hypothetical protein [uncultured Ruthenibacterium sp.]|uniref:hypothetical protein n=1 Tax=uncultured Ruthenibacterium sp. TaxID=1905347 RepID=UPI00349EDC00
MRRKVIGAGGLLVLVAAALTFYFWPMSAAQPLLESDQLLVMWEKTTIANAQPDIEVVRYDQLTQDQQNRLWALLEQARYQRTFATPFSDGSAKGLSDEMLYVHGFKDGRWCSTIFFSSNGEFSADYKNYRLSGAPQLMDEMLNVCQ